MFEWKTANFCVLSLVMAHCFRNRLLGFSSCAETIFLTLVDPNDQIMAETLLGSLGVELCFTIVLASFARYCAGKLPLPLSVT